MSCKYCNGKGIPWGSNQEFCVFENNGHPEIVIPLGNGSVRANIDLCPKCGRDLKNKKNEFDYSIQIPVPLGERVWTFWTTCCNACCFQPRDNKPISCNRGSACHTLKHAIQSKELSFNNLEEVINGWGVYYFKTSAEAEAAGNKRIEENIKKMRELGYQIDDQGYALKKEGWDNIDE